MKKISMSEEFRDCPHCKSKGLLAYYREDSRTGCDLYYCTKCFGMVIWDAHQVEAISGEAYPDRYKKEEIKFKELDENYELIYKSEAKFGEDEIKSLSGKTVKVELDGVSYEAVIK